MAAAQIQSLTGLVLLGEVWGLWPVAISGLHLACAVRMAKLQETMTKKSKTDAAVHGGHVILKLTNRSVFS